MTGSTKPECIAEGCHLTICDDDGYCSFCGYQESEEELVEEDKLPADFRELLHVVRQMQINASQMESNAGLLLKFIGETPGPRSDVLKVRELRLVSDMVAAFSEFMRDTVREHEKVAKAHE